MSEYTVIAPDASVGLSCEISSHVFIGEQVVLGDYVSVGQGAHLDGVVVVENNVVIGPGSVLVKGLELGSETRPTRLLADSRIGGNVTIYPGVTVGVGAVVAHGSVLDRDVPDFAEVGGNPATIRRYHHSGLGVSQVGSVDQDSGFPIQMAQGPKVIQLSKASDIRGSLVAGEIEKEVPFDIRRFFFVYDVPSEESRGAHAHRECHQLLIALGGTVNVIVSDGSVSHEVVLDSPQLGLHVPPMIWGIQYKYSRDAILLVLASHEYDPEDYIRDFSTFVEEKFAAGR